MRAVMILIASVLTCGCAEHAGPTGPRAEPDLASFEHVAYPILLRDCSFAACHGAGARPFQVYGPGRTRLDALLAPSGAATALEIQASYTRAVSMLRTDRDVERSLLLSKPLATAAGGQHHGGTDLLGRNVYGSRADPGYAMLRAWGLGAAASTTTGIAGAEAR